MKRETIILKHINKDGVGLEIGPSHAPVAPKTDGYNVQVVDHADRNSLIEKYRPHGVAIERIEEVDHIWHGESYAALTGKTSYYDWIIASHVIEHTPNLVEFLNNCAEVLKDDGLISLAIPDARYCFDFLRPLTGIGQIIDANINQLTMHSPGTAYEYCASYCSSKGKMTWGHGKTRKPFIPAYSVDSARTIFSGHGSAKKYADYHSWCFTPHSFRLIMYDLYQLGLTSMQEVAFYPTRACEFYVVLGKKGETTTCSRLELMQKMRDELREDISFSELVKLKTSYWLGHIRRKLVSI